VSNVYIGNCVENVIDILPKAIYGILQQSTASYGILRHSTAFTAFTAFYGIFGSSTACHSDATAIKYVFLILVLFVIAFTTHIFRFHSINYAKTGYSLSLVVDNGILRSVPVDEMSVTEMSMSGVPKNHT
jgi:hypothetical protein